MRLRDGRYVDETSDLARPELLDAGAQEVRTSRLLVLALVAALVTACGLGAFFFVEHWQGPEERAAAQAVQAYYAAWNAHDAEAVWDLMTPTGTHDGNGALGGDARSLSLSPLHGYLTDLLGSNPDLFVELTGPPRISRDGDALLVSVPNRLGYRTQDGATTSVAGYSQLALVDVDGQWKVARHSWWEQGYLAPARIRATPVKTCPPGSHPDRPGPTGQARPSFGLADQTAIAMDTRFGRLVAVVDDGTFTYDVCTNTWTRLDIEGPPARGLRLVYDASSGVTIAFSPDSPGYWTFETGAGTWTRQSFTDAAATPGQLGGALFAYDSSTGLVLVLDRSDALRSFDVDTNTWTLVPQQMAAGLPGLHGQGYAVLTYDPFEERLLLAALGTATWTFDARTWTWAQADASPPDMNMGYFANGGAITYHTAARLTVIFSDGILATYDATADRWDVVAPGPGWPAMPTVDGLPYGPLARHDHTLVYDPVNQRLLLVGGHARIGRTAEDPWQDTTDVWAYDLPTNTWTELVPGL